MDDMSMDDTDTPDASMAHAAMSEMTMDAAIADVSKPVYQPVPKRDSGANKFDQPFEACGHCVSHSGVPNAPVSSVRISGQSGKDVAYALSPVSRFLVRPPLTIAQLGLPREHAPPGTIVPRNILISVFLI